MIEDNRSAPRNEILAWAAEQLGLPADSSPAEFTDQFFRRLEQEDFIPPPILREAWELGRQDGAPNRPNPRAFEEAVEERLFAQIEQFAAQFFDLPPSKRLAAWQQLYDQARVYPRLEIRLARLKPGLSVEFDRLPAAAPEVLSLIRFSRELFVLRPDRRALRRREIQRHDIQGDLRNWEKAARIVLKRHRSVAALAPDLILPLANWRKTMQSVGRNRNKRLAAAKNYSALAARTAARFSLPRLLKIAIPIGLGISMFVMMFAPEHVSYQGPRRPQTKDLSNLQSGVDRFNEESLREAWRKAIDDDATRKEAAEARHDDVQPDPTIKFTLPQINVDAKPIGPVVPHANPPQTSPAVPPASPLLVPLPKDIKPPVAAPATLPPGPTGSK